MGPRAGLLLLAASLLLAAAQVSARTPREAERGACGGRRRCSPPPPAPPPRRRRPAWPARTRQRQIPARTCSVWHALRTSINYPANPLPPPPQAAREPILLGSAAAPAPAPAPEGEWLGGAAEAAAPAPAPSPSGPRLGLYSQQQCAGLDSLCLDGAPAGDPLACCEGLNWCARVPRPALRARLGPSAPPRCLLQQPASVCPPAHPSRPAHPTPQHLGDGSPGAKHLLGALEPAGGDPSGACLVTRGRLHAGLHSSAGCCLKQPPLPPCAACRWCAAHPRDRLKRGASPSRAPHQQRPLAGQRPQPARTRLPSLDPCPRLGCCCGHGDCLPFAPCPLYSHLPRDALHLPYPAFSTPFQ